MFYQSFLIECDYLHTTKLVLSTLDIMVETYEVSYINGNVICLNTLSTFEQLYEILIVELELVLGIINIDKNNFIEEVSCYGNEIIGQISDFFNMIMVSDDINYYLDLIIFLGSYDLLSLKEKDCLEFLSKNI